MPRKSSTHNYQGPKLDEFSMSPSAMKLPPSSTSEEYVAFQDETQAKLLGFAKLIERAGGDDSKCKAVEALAKKYKEQRSVELELLMCNNKTIANNVTFGKVNVEGGKTAYGFTCTISKAGDQRVIIVPDSPTVLLDAKLMVRNNKLADAYKKLSKDFYNQKVKQLKAEQMAETWAAFGRVAIGEAKEICALADECGV